MASGLKPYTDKTNPNARLLIESWLLNTMVVYRIGHPVPDTEGDYDYIRQLAECAVVLSSERIFRELFSDYWLTTLLLTVADDFGMQLPENSVKASALHRALIDNCTDVRLFYRFLHSRYLDLVLFRPRSALRIRKFLSLLFGNLKNTPRNCFTAISRSGGKPTRSGRAATTIWRRTPTPCCSVSTMSTT